MKVDLNLPPTSTITGIVFGGACIIVGLVRDELSLLTFGGGLLGFSGLLPNGSPSAPHPDDETTTPPADDSGTPATDAQ